MVEEKTILFPWHVISWDKDEAKFWLVMVKKIPPIVLWERMKHKAVEVQYLDPRSGHSGHHWSTFIDHYDPVCEEQGNHLWSYEVYNKDLAEEFKEELKWTKEYRDKPYLVTKNNNVLFIEEGGKLVLLEPYKEYQLERIIKEPKVDNNFRTMLLVKDLSTGTKLMCGLQASPDNRDGALAIEVYDKLCEEYTEETQVIMMFLLKYLMRAYPLRPDYIAYFYEKYKKVESREITEEELPDWYYRDEKNVLVQRAPEIERKIREHPYFYSRWRKMSSPDYRGDHDGDVYLVRRLFDFGGDIIETREYVINHCWNLNEKNRDRILINYYMYINGVGIENDASESTAQIKL
ncbi:MAG: hypothetical protein ACTSPV_12245 [Candidatus Hodarchaeales archaeon]